MKFSEFRWHWLACALVLCFSHQNSMAATGYSCSAPTVSISQASYDPFASLTTLTGTATLSCSKKPNDPPMAFALSVDQGLNASGGISYAALSTNTVRYDLMRSTTSGDAWSSANTLTGNITNWTTSSGSSTGSATVNFYMQIPVSQASPYTTAGQSYTDTRIITPSYPNSAGTLTSYPASNGTLSIAIGIPAKCILSSPPGNIDFTYTSFQKTATQRSTSFAVSCATNTQYTMALDSTSGTLVGLNYTLSLTPSGTQTGTFAAKNATITGTMAAGQSGSCTSGCTEQHTRTLTISY